MACVIDHDAAPDAKDERSGAARVIDHDAAPRALDECGGATLPITTRPPATRTDATGRSRRGPGEHMSRVPHGTQIWAPPAPVTIHQRGATAATSKIATNVAQKEKQ